MAKNDRLISADVPPAAPGGCGDYRLGLVLSALNKRLAENPPAEEAAKIQAEIDELEAKMGL